MGFKLAGCLYVKALHLLQGTGLIAVVDINRAAYIAEGLPTTISTCSTEPKSTPFLQRARVIEPLAKSMHAKLISLPVLRASLRSEATLLTLSKAPSVPD
ncbi:hypothetical protein T01_10131 [Trichinella spiralis]|uniref:Uncharacterized protein n=1 Tax=Trichinella spiralis TaxID=6334 RepID=A0A0V1ASL6_TRISP|nr:hypothetical protein T01_10131 [Trichinella spiralis]